jgi:hypothetical protein
MGSWVFFGSEIQMWWRLFEGWFVEVLVRQKVKVQRFVRVFASLVPHLTYRTGCPDYTKVSTNISMTVLETGC